MPFNILLLPLLGGYVFISYWNVTRFDAKRYRGERLLFHSAIAGLVFLLIAFAFTNQIAARWPGAQAWWKGHIPFGYSGTSLLAFMLAALTWIPLNGLFDREKQAKKAVEDWGDFLEMLLNRAMNETKQVSITMKSSKVYVGFVTSSFDPSYERKYMMLMPTLSGYRSDETKEMVIVNDYAKVYQRLIDEDAATLFKVADEFQLVLPIAEIASANLFDPAVYDLFYTASSPDENTFSVEPHYATGAE